MAIETPTWTYKSKGDKQTASEMNELAQAVITNAIELSNAKDDIANLSDDITNFDNRITSIEEIETVKKEERNQPNGYAGLDSSGKVPIERIYGTTAVVTDVAAYELLPTIGSNGVIYNVLNTGSQYKWSGSAYVDITDGADNAKKNETSIFDCSNGTSTKYYSSLSEAINVVPPAYRTSNRIISYLSTENSPTSAVNYQYHGIDSATWTDLTKWERIPNQADLTEIRSDLSETNTALKQVKDGGLEDGSIELPKLSPTLAAYIGSGGEVTNQADDDDLENTIINGVPVIREKTTKTYNPENYSGMGRVILRKNMVNGVNVLTQEMINQANTIYEIRYDFDLNGAEITIPEGCVLDFQGGSLNNGSIIGNKTVIINCVSAFDEVHFEGDWNVEYISTKFLKNPYKLNSLKELFNISSNEVYNIVTIEDGYYEVSIGENITSIIGDNAFNLKSNTHLIINGTIQLVDTPYRAYNIVRVDNKSNVKISGSGHIIGNRDTMPIGIDGEFGFGIWSHGYNISIEGIKISKCWGDSIMIGEETEGNVTNGVIIDGVELFESRRQGISVLNGKNIIIRNCKIHDIHGTSPESSIDIEPLYIWQFVDNIEIYNCECYNCRGIMATTEPNQGNKVKNIKIYNNIIKDTHFGITCRFVENCVIDNNIVNNKTGTSITAVGKLITVSNNNITNQLDSDLIDNATILIGNSTTDCKIINNKVFCKGYFITGWDNALIEHNTIECKYLMTYDPPFLSKFLNISIKDNDIICSRLDLKYYYLSFEHNYVQCDTLDFINGYYYITNNNIDVKVKGDYNIPARTFLKNNYIKAAGSNLKFGFQSNIDNNILSDTSLTLEGENIDVINNKFININDVASYYITVNSKDQSIINNTFPITVAGNNAICLVNIINAGFVNFTSNKLSAYTGYGIKCVENNISILTAIGNVKSGSIVNYTLNGAKLAHVPGGVNSFGASSNRPNYMIPSPDYFDTDLKKPVWYNGTSRWVDSDGNLAGVKKQGTFDEKPSQYDISIGYSYFCTNKQTTEGTIDGIMIYHKGNGIWVDALGRVVS